MAFDRSANTQFMNRPPVPVQREQRNLYAHEYLFCHLVPTNSLVVVAVAGSLRPRFCLSVRWSVNAFLTTSASEISPPPLPISSHTVSTFNRLGECAVFPYRATAVAVSIKGHTGYGCVRFVPRALEMTGNTTAKRDSPHVRAIYHRARSGGRSMTTR